MKAKLTFQRLIFSGVKCLGRKKLNMRNYKKKKNLLWEIIIGLEEKENQR